MKLVRCFARSLAPFALAAFSLGASAESLGPTLDRIAETGTIFIGHRESAIPFSYVVPGREAPEGFSIEVCAHVVKAIEEKLGKKLQQAPVVTSANSRIMMVKAGMVNMECGLATNTVSRAQQVSFSTNFFVSEVKVMVRADSGIKSINDLADKRVVTTLGGMGERLVKQAAMTRKIAVRSLLGRSDANAMSMLESSEVDAYVGDDVILAVERAQTEAPEKYLILTEGFAVEPYGIVLPKDDPQFKKLVDETLVGLMKSGRMEKIYHAWFMSPIPPNNQVLNLPLSPLNKAAFANPGDRSIN